MTNIFSRILKYFLNFKLNYILGPTKEAKSPVKNEMMPALDQMMSMWLSMPLLPSDIVVQLKKGKEDLAPLFIASPIQGSCVPLQDIANKMERSVYGLQYPSHLPNHNIPQLANSLLKVNYIKNNFIFCYFNRDPNLILCMSFLANLR